MIVEHGDLYTVGMSNVVTKAFIPPPLYATPLVSKCNVSCRWLYTSRQLCAYGTVRRRVNVMSQRFVRLLSALLIKCEFRATSRQVVIN